MSRQYLRLVSFIGGSLLGWFLGVFLLREGIVQESLWHLDVERNQLIFYGVIALLSGLISIFLATYIIEKLILTVNYTASKISKAPPSQILSGSVGMLIGLASSYFISNIFSFFPIKSLSILFSVLLYLFFGYLGIQIAVRNFGDIPKTLELFKKSSSKNQHYASPKIIDTSAIIDGRIADVCRTGFIEGELIISEFVLKELRHIADSSDSLKRTKGRRGLDILKVIQQDIDVPVRIVSNDYDDIDEVDMKLVKLAMDFKGDILTNDFNLNKVADLQGVKVLNVNELSNAVKPNAIPGEEMDVTIIKEGKEADQGIAYLNDGTMIVVEGARRKIGEQLKVMVTSVLQTPAGRMIFAKPL